VSEIQWQCNKDIWSDDYRVIYSGGEKQERAGVGVIIIIKWGQQETNNIAYHDRIIMLS